MNNWFAAKPERVVVFFTFGLLLIGALAIWAISDPHRFLNTPRSYAAIIGALIFVPQVLIYGRRAWRASRRN